MSQQFRADLIRVRPLTQPVEFWSGAARAMLPRPPRGPRGPGGGGGGGRRVRPRHEGGRPPDEDAGDAEGGAAEAAEQGVLGDLEVDEDLEAAAHLRGVEADEDDDGDDHGVAELEDPGLRSDRGPDLGRS